MSDSEIEGESEQALLLVCGRALGEGTEAEASVAHDAGTLRRSI